MLKSFYVHVCSHMRERQTGEDKEQRREATADIQSETPPQGRQGNGHRRVTNGDTNRAP